MADKLDASWRPEGLRCEFRTDPFGIGATRPFLQWRLPVAAGETPQASFELRSAGSAGALGSVESWQSGWIESPAGGAAWPGSPRTSRQRTAWSVRVRTSSGETSAWSEAASFENGLLERSDWVARWIRRPDGAQRSPDRSPYVLRRRFELGQLPATARLYASALGAYELYLNGERLGDGALLRPGWTDYRYRVQYEVIDPLPVLRPGENVLAAVLSCGWYSGRIATRAEPGSAQPVRTPELLAQLELAAGDGRRTTIVSDERWEWAPSAILSSDLYDGEDKDLRLVERLDGSEGLRFEPVEVGTGTSGALVAERCGPLRVVATNPARVSVRQDGTVLVDSGANDTGYLRLQVRERRGRAIEVEYAEIVDPSGKLYRDNLRGARCRDTFVCAGSAGGSGDTSPADDGETLEPSFSYRGYRYAVVRGLSRADNLLAAEAVTLGSEMERTGHFSSSNRLLEQLHELMVCSLRANYVEAPTDCPQRDERMGWMADAQVFAPVAAYTYDIAAFMSKWFDDILDARTPAGGFADVAPRPMATWPGRSFVAGAPSWADAGVQIPWLIYLRYGNVEPLQRMFPAMRHWLALVHDANPDGIWRHGRGNDYGDWVPAGPDTSHDLFSTCWLYRSSVVASKVAGVLGESEAASWLDERAATVRAAFHEHYVDPASGRIADPARAGSAFAANHFAPVVAEETQTGYVLPLVLGLLDETLAVKAGERLAGLVTAAGNRLETGFNGSAFILDALERAGHPGLAYELLLRTEPPSLGFMVEMGATSVWERWDGLDAAGWPACPTMNSFNHYAMSAQLRWLVEGVCGLRPAPDVPALAEIAFRPALSSRVGDASFTLAAPAGTLELGWRWDGAERAVGHLRLPPGMTCTIAGTVSVDDVPVAASLVPGPGSAGDGERIVAAGEHEIVWQVIS